MAFQIIRNDITKVKADAIVNTANPNVVIGDGVDKAIYNAAGKKKLLAEREKIGVLSPGEVAITKAFNLDAKFIIHVSGCSWIDGCQGEEDLLRSCYDKALNMAFDNKCESIAFPLIATGTYGFPKELGIKIAIDSFTSFLQEHEMEITLVVFGDDTVKISGELALNVSSFIDSRYEELALDKEYSSIDEKKKAGKRNLRASSFDESLRSKDNDVVREEEMLFKAMESEECCAAAVSLDDALKNVYTDSFEKHLQSLINKKGLKNSEVYVAANISKQYFSKLLKGQVRPSKEKMLALAIGLKLNLDETIDFLKIAGYALSPISQTDIVVEYFIRNQDYNVLKIDIVLFDYGLEPLSSK